jgi:hypothetical protein
MHRISNSKTITWVQLYFFSFVSLLTNDINSFRVFRRVIRVTLLERERERENYGRTKRLQYTGESIELVKTD